jgi:hypothetical protein
LRGSNPSGAITSGGPVQHGRIIMAKRTRTAAQGTKPQPARQYPAPKHLPRGKGGGGASWTVGDGATIDAVARLRTLFDADAQVWKETTPSDEDLAKAVSYWLGYPLWLEQVGYWWARDETRYSAYIALNRVHHRATEILMEAAERLGIDSAPLMESAQWCRQLLAEPEIYRATGETWPTCLEASRDSLPAGAWEAAQKGYATLARLSAKLESKPDDGPWSKPDGPTQWAKKFGFSSDTLMRRFKAGTIRHKKLSSKSYCIHVDDLPK